MITTIPALCHRRTTKLTTPDHQSVLQHPAGLEVFEQARNRLVNRTGIVFMTTLEVSMLVPAVMARSRTGQLNKAHTTLEEATRHQTLGSENTCRTILMVDAIETLRCIRFAAQVIEIRNCRLHFEGQLIVLNSSFHSTRVARRAQNTLI